ncbi:MAG TPA: tetratricopeptide repeat protein [Spirochaetota bacterium]|nr:tetratricopeptide repeat protein [Spirochaetota bacterium]HNT10351.1 tetratricopeptide repeat protein [Spirochaetota bacterium]HOS40355.1 tetratricopeptide repeat protein [Spirochaetota bacterium]HPU88539.1 tetratricopeptide repeat protein [Spirochaetota bacterium]
MRTKTIVGILLIVLGVALFLYYDRYLKPEREARILLTEGKIVFERGEESGDKIAINQAIGIFSKVIARYSDTKVVPEAYYYVGQCYEKLKLYKLAYLKYAYLIKNQNDVLTKDMRKDVHMRIAHINILKNYSEEGVNRLYDLLNNSFDKDFRSRVYTELGHAYLNQGSFQKAGKMFDISLAENGMNEESVLGKARAYKRMGRDAEAFDLYEHFLSYYGAVSQYTNDVRRSYKNQAYQSGLDAYRGGRYQHAISHFNRVLKHFPYDSKAEYALYWTGESLFAMKQFDTAIQYFNRVLSNSHHQKDQDAQIKKGYAYFLSKRFDLAAREFQNYLTHYPYGKYASIAREWKNMSTKEILYRIENRRLPETTQESKSDDDGDRDLEADEEVSGRADRGHSMSSEDRHYENVAEL